MNNTIFSFPKPENEPVLGYKPGSAERKEIRKALDELYNVVTDIPAIIGGKEVRTSETGTVVMPTENHHVLAKYYKVGEKEVQMAIDAAMKAHEEWANTPWIDRASVMQKIATLICGKYRWLINAATMLGQGKIDAPLLDAWKAMRESGELLETTEFAGNDYGTSRRLVQEQLDAGKNVLLNLEIDRAAQVKASIAFA